MTKFGQTYEERFGAELAAHKAKLANTDAAVMECIRTNGPSTNGAVYAAVDGFRRADVDLALRRLARQGKIIRSNAGWISQEGQMLLMSEQKSRPAGFALRRPSQ